MSGIRINEGLDIKLELMGLPADEGLLPRYTGMDDAVIGVAGRCGMEEVLVYDMEKLTELFCLQNEWTEDMAEEWIDHNVIGGWIGEQTPLIMRKLPDQPSWVAKAGRTAIHREALPAPIRHIIDDPRIRGHVLDFGCGRDRATGQALLAMKAVRNITLYDPNWVRGRRSLNFNEVASYDDLRGSRFDTILCTYVMNVLPMEERRQAYEQIFECLMPKGTAFITVRKDNNIDGYPYQDGRVTSIGTFQKSYCAFNFYGEVLQFAPKYHDVLLMPPEGKGRSYITLAVTRRR